MKVKDLIRELKDCNQESEIFSNNGGRFYYHFSRLEKENILESNGSSGALIDTPIVILIRENTAWLEKN